MMKYVREKHRVPFQYCHYGRKYNPPAKRTVCNVMNVKRVNQTRLHLKLIVKTPCLQAPYIVIQYLINNTLQVVA